MYYLIKHGFRKPTTKDLAEYQLGWSIEDGALYIHDPKAKEPIQLVISDKALDNVLKVVKDDIETSAKKYYNQHMTSTAKVLRDTYERNVIYSITYDEPKGESHTENDTVGFNFYKVKSKEAAVSAFISAWKDKETLGTTIDLEGVKVIVTDNKLQNVYFFLIIKDEKDKLIGKYLTQLESSLPNMSLTYSKDTNKIFFKFGKDLINELSLDGLVLRGGEWGEHVEPDTPVEPQNPEPEIDENDYEIVYGWNYDIIPKNFNYEVYDLDESKGTVEYIGKAMEFDVGDYRFTEEGFPTSSHYVTIDGSIEVCDNPNGNVEGYVKANKVKKTSKTVSEENDITPEVVEDENSN